MYEARDHEWKMYRKALNEEPLENYQDLRDAFNAGWEAHKENAISSEIEEYKVNVNKGQRKGSIRDT